MSIKVTVIGGAAVPEPTPAPGAVKPTVLPRSVLPGSPRTVTAMPSAPAAPVVAARGAAAPSAVDDDETLVDAELDRNPAISEGTDASELFKQYGVSLGD
jgi:hypothetical protein